MDNNKKAVDRFLNNLLRAKIKIAKISECIDNNCNVTLEEVNWGDVGNLGRLNRMLDDIMTDLNLIREV